MAANPSDFFSSESRLAILKAVQSNQIDSVRTLLASEPTLIQARSSTKGSTLLHVAVLSGHTELCRVLLTEYSHETNPIDKTGKTPYQYAKTVQLKSLLAEKHAAFLVQTDFTSAAIPEPTGCIIARGTQVLSRQDYAEFPLMKGAGVSYIGFGLTALSPPTSLPKENKYGYMLPTFFREDIIMTPYYGELLVVHENEQATRFLEQLAKANGQPVTGETLVSMIPKFEVLAYSRCIAAGLERYPFLGSFPTADDAPEVAEAKKMFIAFLLRGFMSHYPRCSIEDKKSLGDVPAVKKAYALALTMLLSPTNKETSKVLEGEMALKYYSRPEAIESAASATASKSG